MGPVVIVGEGKLLQVAEDIGSQLMDDRLAHPVGNFYFGLQGEHGIQDDQQRVKTDSQQSLNIPLGDNVIHHRHEKTGNEHGKRTCGEHEEGRQGHILFKGKDIMAEPFELP